MMNEENGKALIQKYLDGRCTPDEINQVEEWYNHTTAKNAGTPFTKNLYIEQEASLAQLLSAEKTVARHRRVSLYHKYKWLGYAASLAIGLAVFYFLFSPVQVASIEPGGNKAILTLADGTKIDLSNAKTGAVANRSGLQVIKTANGQIVFNLLNSGDPQKTNAKNIIQTPKGGEYMVTLPDGSQVWLNAASTLSFPTTFDVTRNVELSGEAYFEIKKDKKHPFIVVTDKQQVQVLGTHFNVNAYVGEKIQKTTLLEGSVLVASKIKGKSSATLIPNQEAFNDGADITVKDVIANREIDWHNGRFTFNHEPLGNIMKKLARWYDLKVIYKDKDVQFKTLAGSASRYAKISDILNQLELTGEVKFEIKGKEITVMN